MKLLVTSDWQMSWSNLDKIQVIVDQVSDICNQQSIKVVIINGDLKEHYSPVQVQVTNAAVKHVHRLTKEGIVVVLTRGNHDRSSMSEDSEDWFPALHHAGAVTVSKFKVIELDQGYKLVVVPYQTDNIRAETMFRRAKQHSGPKSVLLFHNEVKGSQVNVLSKLPSGVPICRLFPDKYLFCFGGHIHLHQKLADNAWYIGSPFCQDWSEANQRKGLLVADLTSKTVQFIPTHLPRYYDESWPGFPKNSTNWKGSLVRVHASVPENVHNIGSYLAVQRAKAEAKYKGAEVVTVPEFIDKDVKVTIKTDQSDRQNIEAFVDATCPDTFSKAQVTSLLQYYLQRVGGFQAQASKISLTSVKAENFLSFKKLQQSYKHSGLTIVTGRNEDWGNKSNGSGKTSLLQLPLVGLFGQTLKGQANDHWSRRFAAKKRAFVDLRFCTHDGKKCRVYRSRRPVKLRLFVDGKDRSTGIGVRGTQAAIERLTGLSWETVANTMYVDQAEVNTLLLGTDAERKTLFGKFLNLDRFEKARDLIRHRQSVIQARIEEAETSLTAVHGKLSHIRSFLQQMPKGVSLSIETSKRTKLQQSVARLQKEVATTDSEIGQFNKPVTKLRETRQRIRDTKSRLDIRWGTLDSQIRAIQRVQTPDCPTCYQPVDQSVLKGVVGKFISERGTIDKAIDRLNRHDVKLTKKLGLYERRQATLMAKGHSKEIELTKVQGYFKATSTRVQDLRQLLNYKKKSIKERNQLKAQLTTIKNAVVQYDEEQAFVKYALDSFSKNGLPMYLAGQLCPQLNRAAKHYSEVFSDKVISVKFQLAPGSIDLTVVNVHGGEGVKDQSRGELRIASLITSFALIEVMNPTNLTVLDEPGEGLDFINAQVFAKGLKTVAKRLGPVMITTHSPYILAELENERTIEVVKHRGVSRVMLKPV